MVIKLSNIKNGINKLPDWLKSLVIFLACGTILYFFYLAYSLFTATTEEIEDFKNNPVQWVFKKHIQLADKFGFWYHFLNPFASLILFIAHMVTGKMNHGKLGSETMGGGSSSGGNSSTVIGVPIYAAQDLTIYSYDANGSRTYQDKQIKKGVYLGKILGTDNINSIDYYGIENGGVYYLVQASFVSK